MQQRFQVWTGSGASEAMWDQGIIDSDDPDPTECICGASEIKEPWLCQCRGEDEERLF